MQRLVSVYGTMDICIYMYIDIYVYCYTCSSVEIWVALLCGVRNVLVGIYIYISRCLYICIYLYLIRIYIYICIYIFVPEVSMR